jgi:agmatine deiminase
MSSVMPPEWAPHSATWMGFPAAAYPEADVTNDDVWQAWATVANVIVDHEPVNMLCRPEQLPIARRLLSSAVTLHEFPIEDAWLRDTGPTFVAADNALKAVDWRFNGWGDNTTFAWGEDAKIATHIAELLDIERISSQLTNEGGGLHVSGDGLVLLTDTVQLDPDRNPKWTRRQVEEEVHRLLGTGSAIWLPHGLWRDYAAHGTRGHVDIVACFNELGSVLLHRQRDRSHPDCERYELHRQALEQADLKYTDIVAPKTLEDRHGWVDYSYINHYVLNGAVVVPTFSDPNDGLACEQLAEAWPERDIRIVDARVIFAMGGGIHCITQQQPRI